MGEAIGDMLPAAVGVAISPLPIVAVVLMLVTARGRANGPAFLLGWIVGVAGAGAILLVIASGADAHAEGQPADWVNWLKLILGLGLLALAATQWRRRPHEGAEAATPRWMGSLDAFTPAKAGGAGIVLSALNPKNLLLIVAGMAAIAETGISAGEQTVALLVFTVVASIGVAAPVVIYFALGERSADLLDRLKTWMTQNNAVIMAVLLLVIGVKLIGDAISGVA
ncbi:MAG: GAP family protein [Gaiella sp.]|nr:GAP family protein [Gaiella sp.]